ncbi:MAG: hypothetical protein MZU84_06530 [Sphingobacterium sp.]|nr:hypothetical protein [Sphingobacterium sp.]
MTLRGSARHSITTTTRSPWWPSERPVIQTTLNLETQSVHELKPGHALIVKVDGSVAEKQFAKPH